MKNTTTHCLEATGYKAVTLYAALCLVALGSGCLKPNIISHGANQFQRKDLRKLSSFFNAAYFAFSMGQLIALTLLVWVQTYSGMDVGFGVSAAVMAAGMISLAAGTNFYRNKPPRGSIFTPIAQVNQESNGRKFLKCENVICFLFTFFFYIYFFTYTLKHWHLIHFEAYIRVQS